MAGGITIARLALGGDRGSTVRNSVRPHAQRVELRTAPVSGEVRPELGTGTTRAPSPGPGGAKNSGGKLKTPGLLRLDGVVRGV